MKRELSVSIVCCLALSACHRSPDAAPATVNASSLLTMELAAAKKAGLPTQPQDLQAASPPVSENAAPLYLQWSGLRTNGKVAPGVDEIELKKLRDLRYTNGETTFARQIYANRRAAYALIHQAASKPHCIFVKNWAQGLALLLPELADMRTMTRYLRRAASAGLL